MTDQKVTIYIGSNHENNYLSANYEIEYLQKIAQETRDKYKHVVESYIRCIDYLADYLCNNYDRCIREHIMGDLEINVDTSNLTDKLIMRYIFGYVGDNFINVEYINRSAIMAKIMLFDTFLDIMGRIKHGAQDFTDDEVAIMDLYKNFEIEIEVTLPVLDNVVHSHDILLSNANIKSMIKLAIEDMFRVGVGNVRNFVFPNWRYHLYKRLYDAYTYLVGMIVLCGVFMPLASTSNDKKAAIMVNSVFGAFLVMCIANAVYKWLKFRRLYRVYIRDEVPHIDCKYLVCLSKYSD